MEQIQDFVVILVPDGAASKKHKSHRQDEAYARQAHEPE
jgi:hypothetical protein